MAILRLWGSHLFATLVSFLIVLLSRREGRGIFGRDSLEDTILGTLWNSFEACSTTLKRSQRQPSSARE
jgi:hypothetical protein